MKPYYERSGLTLHLGDCLEVMASLPENSVDTCITDPPYGLEFMGKEWDSFKIRQDGWQGVITAEARGENDLYTRKGFKDLPEFRSLKREAMPAYQAWCTEWAIGLLRVLKPGAILMAFGGTRTHHRLMSAIEDAGFEIRDCMMWLYGSGFPKSLDISKAIDKAAGVEREDKFEGSFERRAGPTGNKRCEKCGKWLVSGSPCQCARPQDEPQSDSAKEWDGYGTALKPAWEPIIVAMKPLDGTFAENAQKWGVAGLAIDAGRISYQSEADREQAHDNALGPVERYKTQKRIYGGGKQSAGFADTHSPRGRWPANLLLDEEAAAMLDGQSGVRPTGALYKVNKSIGGNGIYQGGVGGERNHPADTGGASRFFYVAKASRSERDAGLESMPKRDISFMNTHNGDADKGETWSPVDERTGKERDRFAAKVRNHHPTVKPVALMEYLCTLTRTPTGGIVLDPFMGSGTTGIGAIKTGRPFVGIERDAQYIEIAYNRLNGIQSGMLL